MSLIKKRLMFLLLLVLCSTTVSHGQDSVVYESVFGDSSSVWYIFSMTEGNLDGGTDVRMTLAKDTVTIDGVTYNILRHIPELSYFEIPVYNNEPIFLRENSNHSKLYCWPNMPYMTHLEHEILIMDLDIECGDTLDTRGWSELYRSYFDTIIPKVIIDSIYYSNNRKTLRTNLYHYSRDGRIDTLFFIEGVGPSFGPYYPMQKNLESLTCCYKDDTAIYHGKDFYFGLNCRYGWCSSIEESANSKDYIIYPNPTHGFLCIQCPTLSNYRVAIINVCGRLIYTKEFQGDSLNINIDDYQSGIYYITLMNSEKAKTMKIFKR